MAMAIHFQIKSPKRIPFFEVTDNYATSHEFI